MPDVSVPPTHPDDELVTRKILREELSKYPTKEDLAQAMRAMEESIISKMVALLDPTRDNPARIQRLERQSDGHEVRIAALEAPRRATRPRRKPARSTKRKTR